MNALLLSGALLLLAAVFMLAPADGGPAALITLPLIAAITFAIYRLKDDRKFLVRLFLSAVLVRVLIGTCIYVFHWQGFFGGDAITYDFLGYAQLNVWQGNLAFQRAVDVFFAGGSSSGWGMIYMVAAIYKVVGHNMLATQYVNCVLGATTALLTYMISMEIFPTRRVARVSALMTAFFPSLVLWSCQGLKDGPSHGVGVGALFPYHLAFLRFLYRSHRCHWRIRPWTAAAYSTIVRTAVDYYDRSRSRARVLWRQSLYDPADRRIC